MKTIGIKLADGSFYPVLQEDNPAVKTLELTTAHNNQTKVMVDLYRSKACTMEDAEYVDSLQIENLIAHPNGEPSISFSVSIDEDNELSAKIEDPETGKQSGTTITLVSRTLEERLTTDEYNINDITLDESAFNNEEEEKEDNTKKNIAKAAVGGGLLMAAGALIAKEQKEKEEEENNIDDTIDVIDENVSSDDPLENSIDDLDLPEEIEVEKESEEVPNFPVEEEAVEDTIVEEEAPVIETDDIPSFDDPSNIIEEENDEVPEEIEIKKDDEDSLGDFGNFDDILNDTKPIEEDNDVVSSDDQLSSFDLDTPITEDELPPLDDTEEKSNDEDDATSIVNDLPDFEDFDKPVEENSTESLDDFNIDDLPNFDDEPNTEDTLPDISIDNDEEKTDDTIIEEELPDFNMDDMDSPLGEENNDDSSVSPISDFDIPEETTEDFSLDNEELPEDITTESVNDLDDDDIPSSDIDDILSSDNNDQTIVGDDFATDSITDDEDNSFDLPDDLDTTKSGEDIASDDKFFGNNFGGFGDEKDDSLPNFDDTDEDKTVATQEVPPLDLSDLPDFDETEESETPDFDDDFFDSPSFDESNNMASSANGGLSFTGLYDKETEMGKPGEQEDDVKKKTKTPVIICVICAIICIIATLLVLFIIPSKYNLINKETTKNDEVVVETITPEPVVEEKEEVIPEAKEDEIVVVEKAEEVIPEQPELPEVAPLDIDYKIIWGDTLWDIADSYYKNPWRYKDIARHNDIRNPDHIISGTHITIPAE